MASAESLNSPVAVLREGRVARIVLNEPASRNRLSPEFASALLAAIDRPAGDSGVGCMLLEQRGEVFCSGLEYEAIAQAPATDCYDRLFRLRKELHKPLVAAVHGACAGAGVGLLLQCHYVLAAQGTKFAVTDIHSAVWPSLYYGVLAGALGPRRACELALTGRVFTTPDAVAFGLAQEAVPPFELEDRALQLAAGLASLSPAAIASGLAFAADFDFPGPGIEAAMALRQALATADFPEALAAAREKRRPVWPSLGPEP